MFSTKAGATKLLIGVVVGLIAVKVVVGLLTGSISVLAQAADSLLDLFAAVITFSAIRVASKPADTEHPYGHGKAEDIAGAGQGILILVAGGLIIYSAVVRILTGQYRVEQPVAGMVVMAVSIVVSIFLSRYLLKISRRTNSIALEANARNIATDVYSTSAVLAGLVILQFTKVEIIDPIMAIAVAIYIVKVAIDTIRKPISGLLDEKLPPSQERIIEESIKKHEGEVYGFHALRTRRAGSLSYIDLHLVMAGGISLGRAHKVCDEIESEIRKTLSEASVTIHCEPCNDECERCSTNCPERRPG
jgi:cation diffusion facilitator family transporter